MEFESRVCTTKEQSEKLLSLGLKRETADCFLEYFGRDNYGNYVHHPTIIVNNCRMPNYEKDIPAWSLHRLIEIMPNIITYEDYSLILGVNTSDVYYADSEYAEVFKVFEGNLYDCVVKCFQWLVEAGYIDPEYIDTDKLFSL